MNNKIDRELISELFDKYIDYDKFEYIVYGDRQTDSFIIFYDCYNEDLFIIYKSIDNIKMLCWYKLWHVGRCFNLIGINNKEELEEFFKELGSELKEEGK